MPTYHEIMTTDLSALTTAADSWETMAGDYRTQETHYKTDVHALPDTPAWMGSSAETAKVHFTVTLSELQKAQTEAKAIASLLRDAHTQFHDLRQKLTSARADAIKAGMKVSDQGIVSFDYDKLTDAERTAYHHDPDYQESLRKSVSSWQENIDQCVKNVGDADKGVEVAFAAVVIDSDAMDGTMDGFNGDAISGPDAIEKYEAAEAKDIATRVDSGKATAADYQELQRLFRDNSHDKAFSQTLLDGLGARGMLEFSNKIEGLAYYDDKDHSGRYLGIEKGLATTLATATHDPRSPFYKRFRAELAKAGTAEFGIDGLNTTPNGKIRGYQSLVTLMEQGHGYSGRFLMDTADDIRAAEVAYAAKGNLQSPWATFGDKVRGNDRSWFADDPLDGVLGIMSHDPATSTAYLDPAHNKNLDYLLKGRDWNTVIKGYGTSIDSSDLGPANMGEDGDARKGFAAALEAATTGQQPGTYHPDAHHTVPQARILQSAIDTLNTENQAQKLPSNLLTPMAHIMTSYTSDTHDTFAQSKVEFDRESPGSAWTDKAGNGHISVGSAYLSKIMRGIADDPVAFGHLYGAEQKHAHDLLAGLPAHPHDTDVENRISDCSRAMGAYDGVRSDIIFDKRFNKTQWAADFNHGIGTSFGTALLFQPLGADYSPVGDVVSKGIDVWAYDSNKEHVAEANLEATEENAKSYDSGQHDVSHMVRMWAESRGHSADSGYAIKWVHDGQRDYDFGRDQSLRALRADR